MQHRLRLPRKYARLAYGLIQAGLTAGIATAIATYQIAGLGMEFIERWPIAWAASWATMIPVVVVFAPMIARLVDAITRK